MTTVDRLSGSVCERFPDRSVYIFITLLTILPKFLDNLDRIRAVIMLRDSCNHCYMSRPIAHRPYFYIISISNIIHDLVNVSSRSIIIVMAGLSLCLENQSRFESVMNSRNIRLTSHTSSLDRIESINNCY